MKWLLLPALLAGCGTPDVGTSASARMAETIPDAQIYFQNQFDYLFITKLKASIWYFPETESDEAIQAYFSYNNFYDWNKHPSDPDAWHLIENEVGTCAACYSDGWFRVPVYSRQKIAVVIDYVDSCNPKYRYQLEILPPLEPESETHYITGIDAARACL